LNGLQQNDSFSICLMDEAWHEGVIGILAGRIKESLHRPCVVFAGDDDDNLKGSARSIKGVHIRDVLQSIVALHPGMIEKFGGHAMAAGLTLPRASFDRFRQCFEDTVRQAMGGHLSEREYEVDGSLSGTERTLDNALLLGNLMPWGQGFEAPLFTGSFVLASQREVGNGKHLKMTLEDPQTHRSVDAIAFNCEVVTSPGEEVRLVYSLEVNTWRDRQQLQLRVHHLEAAVLR
jgi:single-stranded-DNA-specific exonuclease